MTSRTNKSSRDEARGASLEEPAARESAAEASFEDLSLVPPEHHTALAAARLDGRWATIGAEVQRILDPDAVPAQSVVDLIHALTAHSFPLVNAGRTLNDPAATALTIGIPPPTFQLRCIGQAEHFAAGLAGIEIPLELRRWKKSTEMLTPEHAHRFDTNEIKLRYPAFHAAIVKAHTESLRSFTEDSPLTDAERCRHDGNLAAGERLAEWVDEFNFRRNDLLSFRLQITNPNGEPVILSAGDPAARPTSSSEIRDIRQTVLGEFAAFLRAEYLQKVRFRA